MIKKIKLVLPNWVRVLKYDRFSSLSAQKVIVFENRRGTFCSFEKKVINTKVEVDNLYKIEFFKQNL